jgi:hypothetical protein
MKALILLTAHPTDLTERDLDILVSWGDGRHWNKERILGFVRNIAKENPTLVRNGPILELANASAGLSFNPLRFCRSFFSDMD